MCKCVQDDGLLDEGHVLKLHNASLATAGTYVCEVVATKFPELKRLNTVHVSVRGNKNKKEFPHTRLYPGSVRPPTAK